MLAITENIADASARRPAIGTLRLQLKPAHRSCGFVQGAWWPRSTELTSELPSLLAALSLRVGSIDSVLYHERDWSSAPLSIKHQGDQVILGAHQEWPNVVSLFGPRFGRLDLLVVPPHTEPTHAYNAVTTVAHVNDASTPDQRLGIGTRRDWRSPALPRRAAAMGIRRRRSASTTITGSDAGRLSTPASRRLRGRRARMWGLAHGPSDRTAAGRTEHHRQATRSPARIPPLHRTGRQTFAASRSTPPVNHPVTGARVVTGGGMRRPTP